MISSELPELLGMSDRIIVMRDGAIAGELARRGKRGGCREAGNRQTGFEAAP